MALTRLVRKPHRLLILLFLILTLSLSASRAESPNPPPYEAANAVAYGLPHDEALKAITLYPAEILGVGDLLGSIEVGKLANLIVTDGDPLEITTEVRQVFIKGRPVSLDNRHRQLYEKYRARP